MCSFSISASGKRCILETANVAGEFTCRTSAVDVEGIVNHVETDECVAACGVDRKTVGISSDTLMEAGFAAKLCSSACLDFCPNILDLYFNLAAGEGVFLPDLCDAQRMNPHRSMLEFLSSGSAPGPVSEVAPGPVSEDVSSPALAPAPMASIYAYGNKNKIVDGLEPSAVIAEHETEGDAYNTSDPDNMDYRGAASIYEDENQVKDKLPPQVVVNHSPGDKNARLRKILVNMFTWAMDNSSPANVMLILGDIREHNTFLAAINSLNMKCFNVLFAQPENKSVPPNFPISTKCLWETLSVGDLLIVQTEPVDNTLEGGRKSHIKFYFAC
ncbi:unnamed protein product [Arabidopsis arenosa]|uniref:Uncharacterized protein n=1 Tax=Arabidopsis arenosa TaxID=38785 RepID=A0A8S2AJ34_ARAAE|nr:unnamed protein product [Arabidopsis arenosa]